MEEYDKILQLVRSDDTNNRLLGFQLAKGQGYDLFELLDEWVGEDLTNYGSSYTIGPYSVFWNFSSIRKGYFFGTRINGIVEHIAFLTNDIIQNDKNAFDDTIMNFKKLFIKLITE